MAKQNHHYFVSTAIGWAVADSRDQAIKMAAKDAGKKVIDRMVKNPSANGLYFWSCKVETPKATNYEIEGFKPVGVPVSDTFHGLIKDVTGKYADPLDEI